MKKQYKAKIPLNCAWCAPHAKQMNKLRVRMANTICIRTTDYEREVRVCRGPECEAIFLV